mmetsp:Transcript_69646/g.150037  ORF Transcript_69646/g.150037 Transcript_69646/m.150037 type:complete len:113 (+) Transcript_69646:114-452(+)
MRIIANTICGMVFGFVMQKGQVFAPKVIEGQFKLEDFTMLKMFLGAFVTSLLFQALMAVFMESHWKPSRAFNGSGHKTKVFLGASVLGIGMTVAGSCPGNVFVQLGSAVENT